MDPITINEVEPGRPAGRLRAVAADPGRVRALVAHAEAIGYEFDD
jgi:hypothetical protein